MRRSRHGQSAPEDHDSPWKGALEVFFQPFMDFLYPHIAELIDWQQPVEFLDKELQKITRKAKNSRRYADPMCQPSCRLNISEDNHGPLFTRA